MTSSGRTGTRLLILHRQKLVGDVFTAALGLMAPGMQIRSTADVDEALRRDGATDVLLAEQALIPPGLRWHVYGRQDGAAWYVAMGDVDQVPAAAALAAVRAGAHAWVPPDVSPARLLAVVDVVVSGQLWLPPSTVEPVLHGLTSARQSDGAGLTAREQTVLELITSGRSTPEIARLLMVSPNTVRTHRNRLFAKLGVHSAVEAAAWSRRSHAHA